MAPFEKICISFQHEHVPSNAQRRQFQKVWHREIGEKISNEQAEAYADALARFVALSISISQNSHEEK